jgi:hypothetical protein
MDVLLFLFLCFVIGATVGEASAAAWRFVRWRLWRE